MTSLFLRLYVRGSNDVPRKPVVYGRRTMNYKKKIVCLANSRKPGGRCVAGKEVLEGSYGGWVRPVSVRATADISMIAPVPRVHQTENHMIDAEVYWTKVGELAWDDVTALLDTPASLWGNGDSTYHGRNDRMTQAAASAFQNSLLLIEPENLVMRVLTPGTAFGNPKRRVRAEFTYQGVPYDLMVTDPVAERVFLACSRSDQS